MIHPEESMVDQGELPPDLITMGTFRSTATYTCRKSVHAENKEKGKDKIQSSQRRLHMLAV